MWKRTLGIAVIWTLASGCGGTEVPTNPIAVAGPPAFNYTNGPGAPGASGVIRFVDGIGFFVTDYDRGLTAFHGSSTTLAEFCAGAPPVPDPLSVQLISSPSGALHALFTAPAHHVLIYPASPPGCAFWATLPLLASGQAKLIRTDNDLVDAGPGANAFGWQANGVLTDRVTGSAVRYSEVARMLVPPSGACCQELVVAIRLH
jgi:hypothetical protein